MRTTRETPYDQNPAEITVPVDGTEDRLLDIADVAQLFRCSEMTVRRILADESNPLTALRLTPGRITVLASNIGQYVEFVAAGQGSTERRQADTVTKRRGTPSSAPRSRTIQVNHRSARGPR